MTKCKEESSRGNNHWYCSPDFLRTVAGVQFVQARSKDSKILRRKSVDFGLYCIEWHALRSELSVGLVQSFSFTNRIMITRLRMMVNRL